MFKKSFVVISILVACLCSTKAIAGTGNIIKLNPAVFKIVPVWNSGIKYIPYNDPTPNEGIDSDNDGLSDQCEQKLGSNLYNTDSDGDGIKDADEFVGCALNPDPSCTGTMKMKDACSGNTGIDSDADGLSDQCEMKLGSDPYKIDTDGDGIMDGDEYVGCALNSDPSCTGTMKMKDACALGSSVDSDGDGLSDQCEMKYGSNPYSPDTDSDGLQDGDEFVGCATNPDPSCAGTMTMKQACSI